MFKMVTQRSVMHSAHTDPELRLWLRWASDQGSTPMFVRTVPSGAGKWSHLTSVLLVSKACLRYDFDRGWDQAPGHTIVVVMFAVCLAIWRIAEGKFF
jgi:hypothetical protein